MNWKRKKKKPKRSKKMKIKHNKKRNTAFIYEALIREATVAAMRGDAEKRKTIIDQKAL